MEKFAFVLIVIIASSQKSDALYIESCEADHECPSGYYCYLETSYCASCTNCQMIHRRNSTRTSCTKGYAQCGDCLPGFWEEILANGKARGLCFPQEIVIEENGMDWNFKLVAVFLLLFMIMILATVISAINLRKYRLRVTGNQEITHCEEPPPYSSLTPVIENLGNRGVQHRLVEEVNQGRSSRINEAAATVSVAGVRRGGGGGVVVGGGGAESVSEQSFSCAWAVSKEDLQEAVPFCQPTYVCENSNTSDDSGVSELDSGDSEISPSWHADLHDETTMPSEWTPNTISASDSREMDLDEGACTEATCERDDDDVIVNSQVSQTSDRMEQLSSHQLLPSMSPQSECN